MRAGFHDGIMIPHNSDEPVAEHLAKVKDMEIRDDDVLLCVYPKSGTHWMYRVVDMLIQGKAVYDVRTLDSTFLDFQDIEKMKELDSPRILVTHLPFNYLPRQIKDKCTKIVHSYRNPKAVLVSFLKQLEDANLDSQKSLEDWTNSFFTPQMLYGGWFSYMDRVSEFRKDNPEHPVCSVTYEDMSQNPLDTVKQLAEFLGVNATEEFCSDVVKACSFDNQKKIEEQDKVQAAMKFWRKGDMNDWKNHMTVAISEKIDNILKERAGRCPFSAQYYLATCR
nr:hypothetical protein BaRGS_010240 [Batillaria attramentaria]